MQNLSLQDLQIIQVCIQGAQVQIKEAHVVLDVLRKIETEINLRTQLNLVQNADTDNSDAATNGPLA